MASITPQLRSLLRELPPTLGDNLDGYARSLAASCEEIFVEANRSREAAAGSSGDEFVVVATLRRLWGLVDGQFRLLQSSLGLLREHEVPRVRVGAATFYRGSPDYREVEQLRSDLRSLLQELEVFGFVTTSSLVELAREMA